MYKEFSKVYDEFMEYADYDMWYELIKHLIGEKYKENLKVLDLGCGTGEILLRGIEELDIDGVDLSLDMLERAAEKLNIKVSSMKEEKRKEVRLYNQDMTSLSLDRKYDVVVSLFDTVNHLTTIEGLDDLFMGVSNHLEEEGLFIFDVVDREFMDEMFPGGVFLDERENMTVIWEHFLEDGLDHINTTFFVKDEDERYTRYIEDYVKRLFTMNELEDSAKKNGLRIKEVHENDELAGRRFFYVLEKI